MLNKIVMFTVVTNHYSPRCVDVVGTNVGEFSCRVHDSVNRLKLNTEYTGVIKFTRDYPNGILTTAGEVQDD